MAGKKFAYVQKKQYLCSVIQMRYKILLITKDLVFYTIAIRIEFTYEKACKGNKKILFNQINYQNYGKLQRNYRN